MPQGYMEALERMQEEENLRRQQESLREQKKSLDVNQAWLDFNFQLDKLNSLTPAVLRKISEKCLELADIIEELEQLNADS